MSRYTHPYEGARVVARVVGTVPSGPNAGHVATVTLHDGLASHGYRSNYERRPCAWVTMEAPSVKDERGRGWRHCWTYSGARYVLARKDFDSTTGELGLMPLPAPMAERAS